MKTMEYVRKNHFLKFKELNKEWVCLENYMTDESWEVSHECARVLRALDGETDPQEVMQSLSESEVEEIIDYYEEQGWLYDGNRITLLGLGSVLYTLFIPNVKKGHRVIARIWNRLLMLLCLPTFISGVYILMRSDYRYIDHSHGYGILMGYIVGLLTGMIFHEVSHACACLGYGGHWFEAGVMFTYFMPGAYVAIDYGKVKNRFRRAQICAAGVECNIALAGLFLLLLKTERFDTYLVIFAALTNVVIAIFNLSLIGGIDGMGIYSELLGVDQLVDKAMNLGFNFKKKKELRKRGINGKATIACCYIVIIFQLLLPIILIMNLVSIVSAFIC